MSGRHQQRILHTGLFWPNALAVHKDTLFVSDGAGKILSMDFDGGDLHDLPYLSGSSDHIFGMAVMDTVLLYSKWFMGSLYMVDKLTGQSDLLVANLSLPATIILHHPTNLTAQNQCSKEGQACEGSCIPVPRTFHCACPVGSKLDADGRSCNKLATPWEVTEDSLCSVRCHQKAYCSQLVPLLRFQCVFKEGYEGDGIRCTECGANHYKPLLGNETCVPCPPGSDTQGISSASQCICKAPGHIVINGACEEPPTTAPTTSVTTTELVILTDVNPGGEDLSTPWTGRDGSTPDLASVTQLMALPYFENCPHGDTMLMRLPESSDRVWLTVNWTARDGTGAVIQTIPNVTMSDNKIALSWIANGQAGQQTVRFEARDAGGQRVVCQFHILVEDFVSPKFNTCPHNIIRKTSLNGERISWTPPEATDNVGDPTVTTSHQPQSEFPIGKTHVTYTAIDAAGNRAVCKFNVTLIYEQPCNLPPMANGRFVCGSGALDICHIVCAQEYILNPLGVFRRSFSCLVTPELDNLRRLMKKQEPCLHKRRPKMAHQEMALSFRGPCLPDDIGLKTMLHDKIVKALELMRLCGRADCKHGPITVTCWDLRGGAAITGTRGGPDSSSSGSRSNTQEERFNMTWTLSIRYVPPPPSAIPTDQPDMGASQGMKQPQEQGFRPGQVSNIVRDTTYELKKLVPRVDFIYREKRYVPVTSSVSTKEIQWLCSRGEMKLMDGCVPCPPGSFLNVSLGRCVLCAEGFYQSAAGQTACDVCEEGATVEAGAVNSTECVRFPAINRWSRFLIIVTCSFGLIFIIMVICVVKLIHSQKQKRLDNKRGPGPGSGGGGNGAVLGASISSPVTANAGANPNAARYLFNPNIYVSASTSSPKGPDYIRVSSKDCFMNPNEYEDLDGLGIQRSTFETFSRRPPGCRDSLSSFRGGAHTDVTFLGGSSPSPNSVSQSSPALMPLSGVPPLGSSNGGAPLSPRGGSKYHLYGDGGFQYTISPNGTMGSFKGSPSPPPYRNLHLPSTNGIGTDDSSSPTHSQTQTLTSLLGDESPYTSRLIRDRLIDPDSPYRIISHERRTGAESPYSSKLSSPRRVVDSVESSPHHINADAPLNSPGPTRARMSGVVRESPYRSPALMQRGPGDVSQSLGRTPQTERRMLMAAGGSRSPALPYHHFQQDPGGGSGLHHTFDGVPAAPASPLLLHQAAFPSDADNQSSAFVPVGDFLYKRPPSPLSPPITKPRSSESLHRSPSTPRASPGMSRKRLDNTFRSPPMNQRRKAKTELGAYEYEYEYE